MLCTSISAIRSYAASGGCGTWAAGGTPERAPGTGSQIAGPGTPAGREKRLQLNFWVSITEKEKLHYYLFPVLPLLFVNWGVAGTCATSIQICFW